MEGKTIREIGIWEINIFLTTGSIRGTYFANLNAI